MPTLFSSGGRHLNRDRSSLIQSCALSDLHVVSHQFLLQEPGDVAPLRILREVLRVLGEIYL